MYAGIFKAIFGGSYYLNEWINGGMNDEFDFR